MVDVHPSVRMVLHAGGSRGDLWGLTAPRDAGNRVGLSRGWRARGGRGASHQRLALLLCPEVLACLSSLMDQELRAQLGNQGGEELEAEEVEYVLQVGGGWRGCRSRLSGVNSCQTATPDVSCLK